ncbi:unnamed protein product, partial [Timema podura]|nr:unnamed protein product [Timema podura]
KIYIISQNGADDVKRHRWFKGIEWQDVYNKKLKPPIVPRVTYEGDTRNFDDYPETDWKSAPTVGEIEQKLFEDF